VLQVNFTLLVFETGLDGAPPRHDEFQWIAERRLKGFAVLRSESTPTILSRANLFREAEVLIELKEIIDVNI